MSWLGLLAACAIGGKPPLDHLVAELAAPDVDESSGLALGSRPGALWTIEDSGNDPVLFAFDLSGALLGAVPVEGAAQVDWEDLAAFDLDGTRWLLVADTGDNLRRRAELVLYLLAEPDPTAPVAPLTRAIRFRFPDGAHDCEAVAVDPADRRILLVTKDRGDGTAVWSLPLDPAQAPVLVATRLAALELAPPGDDAGRRVTALDLSPDGTRAAVLTYTVAWEWTRPAGASWAEAFAGAPRAIPVPDLPQREALAYAADGRSLYLTSEGAPMPLVRVPLGPGPDAP